MGHMDLPYKSSILRKIIGEKTVPNSQILLEPVCCKKQQKKVPDKLLVCGIGTSGGPE